MTAWKQAMLFYLSCSLLMRYILPVHFRYGFYPTAPLQFLFPPAQNWVLPAWHRVVGMDFKNGIEFARNESGKMAVV